MLDNVLYARAYTSELCVLFYLGVCPVYCISHFLVVTHFLWLYNYIMNHNSGS